MKTLDTTTGKKQIARAALIVMAAFMLSRVLGLAREMIISSQFGTSGQLDSYLAAFRIPDLLFQVIAGGALGSALIPTFTAHLTRDDEAGAWRLASAIANLLLVFATVLAILGILFAPLLVKHLVAPGFDPTRQAMTTQLMRYMLISAVLFGISGIVMSVLNSYQHFLLPALAPAVYNLSIIVCALLFAQRLGVRSLAVGVVAGAALHLAIQVPQLLRQGMRYTPTLGLKDPSVYEVGRLMLPRALGLAIVQINFLVNAILASRLGVGSLAALNYAWLLMLLPQGIVAQGIATAAFPTFSALAAQHNVDEMRNVLSATLRAVFYISIPASVGLYILRVPLVQLLFQRGVFDAHSTDAVAWALQFYAIALCAHAALEIVTRAFYALHDTATPVAVGVAAMIGNILLSLLLIGPLSYAGLALANSLATITEVLALLWIIRGRMNGLEDRTLGLSLVRILLATLGMAWVTAEVQQALASYAAIVQVAIAVLAGGAVYLSLSVILGSSEVRTLWGWVRHRA